MRNCREKGFIGNGKFGNDTKFFKNIFGNDTKNLKNIFGNDTIFL
jgi:hypothetical protein